MNQARESSRRLADLLRFGQVAMADFLVALADFDRQRLWVQLGHSSVFYYLHRDLGLSTGAAHYRKVAVEICPAEVVPRREVVTEVPRAAAFHLGETPRPSEHRDSTEPLTPDLQRLHMTVSKGFIEKLEMARKGQGHAQPGASAEKVLETALDLLLAQQAKRRAEVRQPQKNPRPSSPGHVPAAVRRAVWSRDDGKCTWPLDSGGICGSTLRLEIDHVVPRGRGGASTADGCRLLCRVHNMLAARQVYGDDWMDQFTSREGRNVPVARDSALPWNYLQPPAADVASS